VRKIKLGKPFFTIALILGMSSCIHQQKRAPSSLGDSKQGESCQYFLGQDRLRLLQDFDSQKKSFEVETFLHKHFHMVHVKDNELGDNVSLKAKAREVFPQEGKIHLSYIIQNKNQPLLKKSIAFPLASLEGEWREVTEEDPYFDFFDDSLDLGMQNKKAVYKNKLYRLCANQRQKQIVNDHRERLKRNPVLGKSLKSFTVMNLNEKLAPSELSDFVIVKKSEKDLFQYMKTQRGWKLSNFGHFALFSKGHYQKRKNKPGLVSFWRKGINAPVEFVHPNFWQGWESLSFEEKAKVWENLNQKIEGLLVLWDSPQQNWTGKNPLWGLYLYQRGYFLDSQYHQKQRSPASLGSAQGPPLWFFPASGRESFWFSQENNKFRVTLPR
jgi:hypothetical protein